MLPFAHISVLADEVLAQVAHSSSAPSLLVDCTLGGAGHASLLLQAYPSAEFLGIDRDPTAVAVARERLAPFGSRVRIVHAPFSEVASVLEGRQADFLFADFGVSSHQLDEKQRGFSFREDAPLDMRMDPSCGKTVAELLDETDAATLADKLWRLGEERRSRALARAILEDRPRTTRALAALCGRVVRKSKDGIDPATRTFQALRMWVNGELEEIDQLLAALPMLLRAGGVFAGISFHSLEDRAVKHALREAARGCICPPDFPVCGCHQEPSLMVLTPKAIRPGTDELGRNPRARSARLRAARRTDCAA